MDKVSNFIRLSSGIPTKLECNSNPPVENPKWFKDGVQLSGNEISGISVSGTVLEVTSPDPETQSGFYHCESENELGLARSRVIRMGDRPPEHPEYEMAPVFTAEPGVEIQPIGSQVKIMENKKN